MNIAEVRDLDGPNLFLDVPAIKVEVVVDEDVDAGSVVDSLRRTILEFHAECDQPEPAIMSRAMEAPLHHVVAFAWEHRAFAVSAGEWGAQLVLGERDDRNQIIADLQSVLAAPPEDDDAPLMIRAAERTAKIVAVTGTNGKTTSSRMIAYVMKTLGLKVGLTSSAGVFINDEQVLKGDYSGPSGARRVFVDPDIDVAVLETARGGLLLRGAGFDLADVTLITNVTEDHLGLHGVYTVEGLAEVKAILARATNLEGYCVLNADDQYTAAMADITPGTPILFSRQPLSDALQKHIDGGGWAVTLDDDQNVIWWHDGRSDVVVQIRDVPVTFEGRATHQVENALGVTGALLGLGITPTEIAAGLTSFRSSAETSRGRLNVYEWHGATVIIDFAHNAVGLKHLLNFAETWKSNEGRLLSVVGTAGDRDDEALEAISRTAAERCDVVTLKDTIHYLRGRESGEMLVPLRKGIEQAARDDVEVHEAKSEKHAVEMNLELLREGDVLAIMCVENYDDFIAKFQEEGKALS